MELQLTFAQMLAGHPHLLLLPRVRLLCKGHLHSSSQALIRLKQFEILHFLLDSGLGRRSCPNHALPPKGQSDFSELPDRKV